MRGFVIESDNCDACEEISEQGGDDKCVRCSAREKIIRELASKWNAFNERIEQRSWRPDEDKEAEAEWRADHCANVATSQMENKYKSMTTEQYEAYFDSEDGKKEYDALVDAEYEKLDKKDEEIFHEKHAVEEILATLGARMMRPYEHWNEEEQYMEWAERDRDYDY
jgi:hypothetical protein